MRLVPDILDRTVIQASEQTLFHNTSSLQTQPKPHRKP